MSDGQTKGGLIRADGVRGVVTVGPLDASLSTMLCTVPLPICFIVILGVGKGDSGSGISAAVSISTLRLS